MNHFLKIILIISSAFTFFSCNDDFVNEKLEVSGVATSAIILSPEWDAGDYQFKCQGVKEGGFTITAKPEWLVLESNSGEFHDSIATIHASANVEPLFSKTGIYNDQMMMKADGKTFAVPVYYINEGNPTVMVVKTITISDNNFNDALHISNSGDGILFWDIISTPDWLAVDRSHLSASSLLLEQGDDVNIPLTFNIQAVTQSNLTGTIVLKTNDKNNPLVEIAVSAYLGTPKLSLTSTTIGFGSSGTTQTTWISNQSSGMLVWSFEGLPDWLTVSTASGVVASYASSNDLTFICNRSALHPGMNAATIYLKSNDRNNPSLAMTVIARMPGVSENVKAIQGNIFDAAFDKSANILYYVTGVPNKLVAYDVTARTVLHEVDLSKAPTCLSIDEDFKKALVGHAGSVSMVDLSSFQLSKTYDLNTTVYDIEWALDDWFCYTGKNSNSYNLMWINSATSETYQTHGLSISPDLGSADLKKIPHQPYIYAYRKDVSPSGIYVYDLNTLEMKSYTHSTLGNAWFSSQGDEMITGYSSIFRTSAITSVSGFQNNDPASIGKLITDPLDPLSSRSWLIDFSEASHSIWAIFSYQTNSYYSPRKGIIFQLNDNDYTLVKTFVYDHLYQPDIQVPAYEVEPRYMFSNSTGTELSVLRKGADNTTWSLEFIPVQ